ncbi:Predicted carbonic anhydrase involved in protection against oxidative damage [Phaffia rhodozyma]|uniref:Carbonic anhydrase n=1 Tax=Phaffia rhodozyma TaxID=264483 RepID=A0A0F7SVE0_PHARH|nr:Predicted carbonic anhydrase involved in protection against oxidative damage [Phaffia rhodozyma]
MPNSHLQEPLTPTKYSRPLLESLLQRNEQWSQDIYSVDPEFFPTSALGQRPKVLWIGCSDSRVPETTLVAARPGDIFVHRNIANQFHLDDDSANAALCFAVEEAGVQHILVVGHTICGGCKAAWNSAKEDADNKSTALSRFISPLIKLRHELTDRKPSPTFQTLVEENVSEAVRKISMTETVQNNWAKSDGTGEGVQVHGLIYHLETGRLHNLHVSRLPPSPAGTPTEEEVAEIGAVDPTRASVKRQTSFSKLDPDQQLSELLKELRIPEKRED